MKLINPTALECPLSLKILIHQSCNLKESKHTCIRRQERNMRSSKQQIATSLWRRHGQQPGSYDWTKPLSAEQQERHYLQRREQQTREQKDITQI